MFVYDDVKLIIEMARKHPVLSPTAERELAKDVFETRVDLWRHLLSYNRLTEPLLTWCFPTLVKVVALMKDKDGFDIKAIEVCKTASKTRGKGDFANLVETVALDLSIIDAHLSVIESIRVEAGRSRPFGTRKVYSGKYSTYLADFDSKMKHHRALREKFWVSNIRLAISMTRKYDSGLLPFCDLLQEALLGLMTGVERFDYRRGLRFSTYATHWIRHSVNRYTANKARTVRWPAHAVADFYKLKKAHAKLNLDDELTTIEALAKSSGITEKKIQKLLGNSANVKLSFDQQLTHLDRYETVGGCIPDESLAIPEEHPHLDPAFPQIMHCIKKKLPLIERGILIRRFGLDGQEPQTLKEIGNELELSRERIRQLQNQALENLRGYVRA